GLLTTVQDPGRCGRRRLGVGRAGAVDGPALAAANRAVGGAPEAAGLECTVAGPTLEFLAPVRLAVTGAGPRARPRRAHLGARPRGASVLARPGNRLRFSGRRDGCRAYVALAGGIDAPVVLGSRATDLACGFGGVAGRALQAGDVLGVLGAARSGEGPRWRPAPSARAVRVRVVPGPQDDHFDAAALSRFLPEPCRVEPRSDRIGLRRA